MTFVTNVKYIYIYIKKDFLLGIKLENQSGNESETLQSKNKGIKEALTQEQRPNNESNKKTTEFELRQEQAKQISPTTNQKIYDTPPIKTQYKKQTSSLLRGTLCLSSTTKAVKGIPLEDKLS